MHELAVMRSVVETVAEHAAGRRVTRIRLVVGERSGVLPHALEFCFDLACADTPLAGAELVLDARPGRQLLIDSIEVI
ncbi:hypothetical protein GCM10027062_14120 [Nocardioides hungaricus]